MAEQNNPAYSQAEESILSAEQEVARTRKEQGLKTSVDVNVGLQQLLKETQVALKLSDESFEQNQYNYTMGLSDINTFTLAQSRKDDAHNNYLSALSDFWMAYYRLCSLTLYDFYHHVPLGAQ